MKTDAMTHGGVAAAVRGLPVAGKTMIDRRWFSNDRRNKTAEPNSPIKRGPPKGTAGATQQRPGADVWIPLVTILVLNLAFAYIFWAKVNCAWPFSP